MKYANKQKADTGGILTNISDRCKDEYKQFQFKIIQIYAPISDYKYNNSMKT